MSHIIGWRQSRLAKFSNKACILSHSFTTGEQKNKPLPRGKFNRAVKVSFKPQKAAHCFPGVINTVIDEKQNGKAANYSPLHYRFIILLFQGFVNAKMKKSAVRPKKAVEISERVWYYNKADVNSRSAFNFV